jgi:hypothetical protein
MQHTAAILTLKVTEYDINANFVVITELLNGKILSIISG